MTIVHSSPMLKFTRWPLLGFDKCSVRCVHHFSFLQESLTTLTIPSNHCSHKALFCMALHLHLHRTVLCIWIIFCLLSVFPGPQLFLHCKPHKGEDFYLFCSLFPHLLDGYLPCWSHSKDEWMNWWMISWPFRAEWFVNLGALFVIVENFLAQN